MWLGSSSRERQKYFVPRRPYHHSTFCRHSPALRKPIAIFHSRNFSLPTEKRRHAARLPDCGLEREHRISLRSTGCEFLVLICTRFLACKCGCTRSAPSLVTPMEDASSRSCGDHFRDMKEVEFSTLASAAESGTRSAATCSSRSETTMPRLVSGFARQRRTSRSVLRQRVHGLDPVSMGRLLWLVEQPSGLTCCRVQMDRRSANRAAAEPSSLGKLAFACTDRSADPRSCRHRRSPLQHVKLQPRTGPTNPEPCLPPPLTEDPMKFSDLLRISRGRAGLTFRAAHRLTCRSLESWETASMELP